MPTVDQAVAVFDTRSVQGEVIFTASRGGVIVDIMFSRLPAGEHGLHIHRAGDLRGEGCKAACDHWHVGPKSPHGGPPGTKGPRHTGDLGNVAMPPGRTFCKKEYRLSGVAVEDLLGRSVIVHADPDDYGRGPFEDSPTTGHSGKRIACAVIGRAEGCE
jgi:Cu-Zn family superoxide dismutase